MTIKTLYTVLGLSPEAYAEDIEDAFNRLKLQHPKEKLEVDEHARARFLAVQQAYETLRNPDARAAYDQKLAKAGVKTGTQVYAGHAVGSAWFATRNLVIVGLILILISGMWVYHARQKAREERETVERLLRMAEEEKRRQTELQEREEARRQARTEEAQQRQADARERQFRMESERIGRQASLQNQNAMRQADLQRRQELQQIEMRQRQEQAAMQQAELAAQRRIQEEKRQLRELCMQRYNRPDC